ncbi:MAG: FAD-dependent oxidoreductase [candidate division Zixibacteria bacterium]|nr:FAD-dependent oxidoreductase [candidate division Zixibacteria bacterium]
MVDSLAAWDKLDEKAYRAKKEEVARILLARLDKVIPGIKDAVEYYEVGTPRTIRRYTHNTAGTPYGFAQTPKQAGFNRCKQQSPIDGLYFVSAWTMPGGGFSGAIISGYFAAKEILGRR